MVRLDTNGHMADIDFRRVTSRQIRDSFLTVCIYIPPHRGYAYTRI